MFHDGNMTWEELAHLILDKMTVEQRATNVTVYAVGEGEFLPMMQLTQTAVGDVLDANHPYIMIDL